ncbi:MAG: hypothetical protein OHK006_22030 [Thermodesulfovibrionales bacterium]
MPADNTQARAGQNSFRLYIAVLFFCPLAFGTVETWSLLIMEAGLLAACFLYLFDAGKNNARIPSVPGVLPLSFMLVFVAVQAIPLPPSLINILSPATAERHQMTIWAADRTVWAPLSLYPKGTVAEFFRLAGFGCAYFLAASLLADAGRLEKTIRLLAVFAGGLAVFAIIEHLTSNGKIYWIRELPQGGTPFGPFVNRNHFAGLMAMLLPSCLAIFLASRRPLSGNDSLRKTMVRMLAHPSSSSSLFLGFGTLLAAVSVFLSLSRGGILSLVGSLCFMALLLQRDRKGGMMLMIFLVLVFYAVGWFGWEPIFKRFQELRSAQGDISELRLNLWSDTIRMIADFSAAGTGAGTFLQAYPAYRTIVSPGIADHAHNDYLELLATLGLSGTALLAWFISLVLVKASRASLKRKDPSARKFFIGAIAGCLAFLLHAFTDFNFFIGSNGLLFFLLMGLAVAASGAAAPADRSPTASAGRPAHRLRAWCFLLLCTAALLFNIGQLLASVLRADAGRIQPGDTSPKKLAYVRDAASRVIVLDPLDPSSWVLRGRAQALSGESRSAGHDLATAVRLSPSDAYVLQERAAFLENTGDVRTAATLFASSARLSRVDPLIIRKYAGFLLRQGSRHEALHQFRSALSYESGRLREYIAMLVLEGLLNQEILRVLPSTAAARIGFAEYLDATGSRDEALSVFQESVKLIEESQPEQLGLYWQTARFAERQGDIRQALEIMRRAASRFPHDAGTALAVGRYAEKMGNTEEAAAAYQRVLTISPDNTTARNRLKALSEP